MKRPLTRVDFDWDDERALPSEQIQLIQRTQAELQLFWDRWHEKPIEQYVACDFEYVARALLGLIEKGWLDGSTFCEWGCGFGLVTGLAWLNGLEAIGIEAEPFLCEQARRIFAEQKIRADIWQGNFLPRGAERLADRQSNHASMFHQVPPAYEAEGMEVDDFALIFAYPWPGEEYFLERVFEEFARKNALLMVFRGPYHLELFRKV